jgi:hypothetical protein
MHKLNLSVLPERLAICKLAAGSPIPIWAARGSFYSITRTADELSLITADHDIPADITCDHDWRAIKVEGPLDFSLTGVLESVARPLADASISIFAIATYDTDYVLVKSSNLDRAIDTLRAAGHTVHQ